MGKCPGILKYKGMKAPCRLTSGTKLLVQTVGWWAAGEIETKDSLAKLGLGQSLAIEALTLPNCCRHNFELT